MATGSHSGVREDWPFSKRGRQHLRSGVDIFTQRLLGEDKHTDASPNCWHSAFFFPPISSLSSLLFPLSRFLSLLLCVSEQG